MSTIQYTITGSCDGYHDFLRHSKNIEKEKTNFIDNRGGDNSSSNGKTCYSLSIQKENYIFSKIQIIRDGLRSQSIGFVRFNLIIPTGFSISDTHYLKGVLDNGLVLYTKQFVDENFVLIDENKKNEFDQQIEELIATIKLEKDQNYNWEVGKLNPAYIYYNKLELSLYFVYQSLFQNKYKKYHEVYFIDENDQGEDIILKALKHEAEANLTGAVTITKLQNPKYALKINNTDEEVRPKIVPLSAEVKLEDSVDIEFSKANYVTTNSKEKTKIIKGTWSDLLREHKNIVKKSNTDTYTIEITPPKFIAEIKEVELKFKEKGGNQIQANELTIKVESKDKTNSQVRFQNGKIEFSGNQINKPITIEIKSKTYKTKIGNISYRSTPITITLEKKKTYSLFPIVGIGLFIGLLLVSTYWFWPFGQEPIEPIPGTQGTGEEIVELPANNTDQEIRDYLNDTELLLHKLEKFKFNTSNADLIKKLDKFITFREAIDGNDQEAIKDAHINIIGLSVYQNEILKIIKNYSTVKFEKFTEIKDRNLIPLKNFKETLNKHLSNVPVISEEEEIDNNHDNIEETSDESNIEPSSSDDEETLKYTEEDFISIILDRAIPDNEKMSQEMKTIFEDYNSLTSRNKAVVVQTEINDLDRLRTEIKRVQ